MQRRSCMIARLAVRNFVSGGYELFRYASPHLVADFLDVTDRSDQIATR